MRWVDETKEMVSRLNSHLDQDTFEKLFAIYLMEDDSSEKSLIRNNIESILGVYAPQLLFSKKPTLQAPVDSGGQILIGNIMQGDRELHPFSVNPETINKHMAIFGATGSGKTSLLANILRQLSKAKIDWLAIDFKRDLRGFVKEDAWVLRWDQLRINPLQPPKGVTPEIWMTIVPDIFAHCFYWFSPSENYMLEFLSQLYGKLDGKSPTIRELYDFIIKRDERNRKRAEYFAVVTNRLASMLTVMKSMSIRACPWKRYSTIRPSSKLTS
jgi:DNA helicase HerA-like ATPase